MMGDKVIKKVANIIQEEVGDKGVVGRIGGDEFFVIFYDIYDMEYLNMREKQCIVLYEMYKTVRLLKTAPHTAEKLAEYLEKMADVFERKNNGRDMLCEFGKLDVYMKGRPLPVEREEFEDRARLFALMRHLEEFIYIKMEFADRFD